MTYDLKNNSGQSERREIISGERKASTYFDQQRVAQELESSGRFAKADVVTGPEAYPAGASWTRDSAGIEPPLGVRVDAMEPTGEAYEVERSLAELAGSMETAAGFALPAERGAGPSSIPAASKAGGPAPVFPDGVQTTGVSASSLVVSGPSAAIPRQAHARLAALLAKGIRKRRVT